MKNLILINWLRLSKVFAVVTLLAVCADLYAGESQFSKYYSIHELREQTSSLNIYRTEGYVVKIYKCPVCPPQAQCKACMGNNIVISEANVPVENYNDAKDTELIIFMDEVDHLTVGKKYRFIVKIRDTKITAGPVKDFELVEYKD